MTQTKIFAHRGVSSRFPENTMAAFQAAVEVVADGIEFDVQLSKDNVPVVIHDLSLDRTTTGSGFVRAQTVKELKAHSAGLWFHADFEKEKIPTLAEVLNWAKSHSLVLNIELKGYVWDRKLVLTTVLPLIIQFGLQDRVILSSFDHKVIHLIQQEAPQLETAVIVVAALHDPVSYLNRMGTGSYHFCSPLLLEEEADALIKQGIRLRPYTVNDREWMNRYMEWGCEGIFTDYPQDALILRQERN